MDITFIWLLIGACGLGIAHAFEVDHMTAVSAFVAQKPSPRHAALFGIKWSIGHGLSLLVLGTVLFALRLTISDGVAGSLERLVGVALLVLGLWTLKQLRASFLGHTHQHQHSPSELSEIAAQNPIAQNSEASATLVHTHADGTTHAHSHDSLFMGILHGAAGTAAFVGQSLVAVSQTYVKVFSFTLAFSVGVLIAMGAYAAALGSIITLGERRSTVIIHGVRALTGIWACGVGIYWIFK